MKNIKKEDRRSIKINGWKYYPEFGRFVHKKTDEFFLDTRLKKLFNTLIDHNGSIVERNEIIDAVWEHVQVNEENLTKGIFDLRKILKSKKITGLEIVTIRNIGYRLIIKKAERVPPNRHMRILLRSALYLILFGLFLVMFIRAIRYEG